MFWIFVRVAIVLLGNKNESGPSVHILLINKFILMATSLGTNVVVVTRVHCTYNIVNLIIFKTTFFLKSFFPSTIQAWNDLYNDAKQAQSVTSFKY